MKKTNLINQKRKNILVTGGAGFIGSHLCEELVKSGNVICVDNFLTSDMENIRYLVQNPNFEFIKHNIIEPLDLLKFPELKKFQVDIYGVQEIYNLACPTSAKKFDKLVLETLLTNTQAVQNIINLALKYEAKLLHASSAVVYGPRQNQDKVKESYLGPVDFTGPRSCYDEGKRLAECLISTYGRYHKKSFKIARIFRTYGPKLALNDGQMISDFIINALDDKDLVIYGDEDFATSLCYVTDIVDGLIKLMGSDISQPVNMGSEDDILLSLVAKTIIKMTNSKSKIVYKSPLQFITSLCLPDISLVKDKLGWYPLATLETGLQKTLDYTLANKQLLTNIVNEDKK